MDVLKKIYSILTPRERLTGLALVGLMVIGVALEMLSIGIAVPALSVMSTGMATFSSPRAQAWLAYLGNPTPRQMIIGGLALFLGIYVVKAVFLLFSSWRQATFVARLQARIAEQMFRGYLGQPWAYHLRRNSADMVRNLGETATLANACTAFLTLLAESLVLFGVLGLLLWHEPFGAVAVGLLLGLASLSLYWLMQRRLREWGRRYWHHLGRSNQIFNESLRGAKDVKILGRETMLFGEVAVHKREQARQGARNLVAQQLPRIWFELIAVGGLCVLTAVMVRQGKSPKAMVPTLGLFAAAAFRMLPSANRLISGLHTLKFSSSIIDALQTDLQLCPGPSLADTPPLAFHNAIRLENVSFRYEAAPATAITDVSIAIPAGSSVGLIGGSGAGKSTLVDVLLGLLAPEKGRVTVDGVDIADRPRAWHALVGYVPQSIFLSDDSLRANVAFGIPADQIDDAAVRRALAAAQLEPLVAELPEGWNTVVGERGVRLSGGQRQRIGIARALYHDPSVLVLDEATSALDTETEKGVMEAVEALHGSKTLIIIAHRLSTVANCDVLYRLEKGRIVAQGSFTEVMA